MRSPARIVARLGAVVILASAPLAATAQANGTLPVAAGFRTAPVMVTQLGGSAIVGGTVIPFKEVTLSAQVPGRVIFLAGAEGHRATEGEVLVRIDDADLQAKRRAAVAQVYQADAGLRNSYMQYNRELYSPRQNSITGFPGMGVPATFD